MIVQVEYMVPVIAVIDTEAGTVEHVVICDEELAGPNRVTHDDASGGVPFEQMARAIEIAHTAEWPAWDHGF